MALIPKAATGLTSMAGPTRVPFAAKMAGLPKPPTSFTPKPPSFKPTLPGGISSHTASRKLTPLGKGTVGAAGAGGIGGSTAGIVRNRQQSQVAKRESVMTTSAWGIEHGEDVSKRDPNKKFTREEKLTGTIGGVLAGTPVGAIAAGAQAKQGKRAKVGFRALGRGFAEGTGAGLGGAAVGGLLGGKTGANVGYGLGASIGMGHGTAASMRSSRGQGWM